MRQPARASSAPARTPVDPMRTPRRQAARDNESASCSGTLSAQVRGRIGLAAESRTGDAQASHAPDARPELPRLRVPGFSEANLYDGMINLLNRLHGFRGRTGASYDSTGLDTPGERAAVARRRSAADPR